MPEFNPTREKTCSKCGDPKPLDQFMRNKECRDGRAGWCLACFSRYMGGKIEARQQILDAAKARPCADCGGVFPPHCMDFDHGGEKTRDVSRMLTYSLDRLQAEIEKCEVVCACCHRVRTAAHWKVSQRERLRTFHLKVNGLKASPCADCGGNFPPVAMDFDHVRGTKFRMVSRMVNYSWPRVLVEVAKCDLVCANCHRTRTQTRRAALCPSSTQRETLWCNSKGTRTPCPSIRP